MKILADENIPSSVVIRLHQEGHDILWIKEKEMGMSDKNVMKIARKEKRVILTFDKDFGDLIYHEGMSAAPGIVLLRIRPRSPQWIASFLCALFKKEVQWTGHFAVVAEDHIRLLALPE